MKYVRILLVAILTMSAASILLLLLAALVLAKTGSLYKAFLPVIATVIGCAAVLLGALASAAAAGEKGWIVGLLCAGVWRWKRRSLREAPQNWPRFSSPGPSAVSWA